MGDMNTRVTVRSLGEDLTVVDLRHPLEFDAWVEGGFPLETKTAALPLFAVG